VISAPVFIDTCVLLKPYLCDTLLTVSESGVYRPMWSGDVLVELDRTCASEARRNSRSLIGSVRCSATSQTPR